MLHQGPEAVGTKFINEGVSVTESETEAHGKSISS